MIDIDVFSPHPAGLTSDGAERAELEDFLPAAKPSASGLEVRFRKRCCNMFSESSTGCWAELQLPWCPRKQGEIPENMLQNILLNLPPQTE